MRNYHNSSKRQIFDTRKKQKISFVQFFYRKSHEGKIKE